MALPLDLPLTLRQQQKHFESQEFTKINIHCFVVIVYMSHFQYLC